MKFEVNLKPPKARSSFVVKSRVKKQTVRKQTDRFLNKLQGRIKEMPKFMVSNTEIPEVFEPPDTTYKLQESSQFSFKKERYLTLEDEISKPSKMHEFSSCSILSVTTSEPE